VRGFSSQRIRFGASLGDWGNNLGCLEKKGMAKRSKEAGVSSTSNKQLEYSIYRITPLQDNAYEKRDEGGKEERWPKRAMTKLRENI